MDRSSNFRVRGKYANNRQWLNSKLVILLGLSSMTLAGLLMDQSVKIESFIARAKMSDAVPYNPQSEIPPKRVPSILWATDMDSPQLALSTVSTVEEKIRAKFGSKADTAIAISKCESGMRANAVGDHKIAYQKDGKEYGKSYGPFQIRHLPGRPDPSELLDVDKNIELAWQISNEGKNWNPWLNCKRRVGV